MQPARGSSHGRANPIGPPAAPRRGVIAIRGSGGTVGKPGDAPTGEFNTACGRRRVEYVPQGCPCSRRRGQPWFDGSRRPDPDPCGNGRGAVSNFTGTGGTLRPQGNTGVFPMRAPGHEWLSVCVGARRWRFLPPVWLGRPGEPGDTPMPRLRALGPAGAAGRAWARPPPCATRREVGVCGVGRVRWGGEGAVRGYPVQPVPRLSGGE